MSSDNTVEHISKLLENHNQDHLLAFWDQLNAPAQAAMLDQVSQLDLDDVDRWVQQYVVASTAAEPDCSPQPASCYRTKPQDSQQQTKYDQAVQLGQQLLARGKVAAFVVAGGQGTRLGFDGPKGNFPITPLKNKTLFQVFGEYIAAAQVKYHAICPWYIMTSPLNHVQTIEILESNDFYGLSRDDVYVFQQGTMPNFSFDGKILLADKGQIACSPDGHGGSLLALHRSGALADMKKRGIDHISYFQVDNPLINIFDPLFIGLHALDNAEMSSRAVIKDSPQERVGNFCSVNGKVTVIEYSDLPDELAEKRQSDGSLLFELGSIAIHMIDRAFVERLNEGGFSLGWHRAVKKIRHIDTNGDTIEPEEPNGVKLESFVFDALPLAEKSIILETRREAEFGPVKNATGVDSAKTARQMIVNRGANWLEAAGIDVPRNADGSPDCVIEIAPSFALYESDLAKKADQIAQINPKDSIFLA